MLAYLTPVWLLRPPADFLEVLWPWYPDAVWFHTTPRAGLEFAPPDLIKYADYKTYAALSI